MQRKQRKEEMGCQVARGEAELSTTVNGSTAAYADHSPLYRSRGFFLVAGVWWVLFGGGLVLVGFGILR